MDLKKNISVFLVKFPRLICYISMFLIKRNGRKNRHSMRIFVLDEFRFREDIDILRQMTDIEYIGFPNILQDKITGIILSSGSKNLEKELSKLIKYFCSIYKSVGFISAGMYYERHKAWEGAALLAKKSFFCLHREGVGADYSYLKKNLPIIFKSARKFKGNKIFVATNSVKKFLVESRHYKEDEVIVTGLPRFDKIYHSKKSNKNSNILVFFSFFIGSDKEGGLPYPKHGGFRNLFNSVHGVIANYALNNPEIEVYIKPKWYEGGAKIYIDNAVESGIIGNNISNVKNLHITDKISAQDLIAIANTVVGFNSTTLVESLLYEKKVIMPKYFEALESHKEYVFYSDYPNVFYYPESAEELIEIIDSCMGNDLAPKDADSDFIEDVAGKVDGLACDRIEKNIKELSSSEM